MENNLKIEWVELEKIIPYVNNPKEHPEEQIKKIASSIKNFGFRVPILIDEKNEIVAGHGRYMAAKMLKMDKVPVIRISDLTPAQIKAFRIADNKVAESGWDENTLINELKQLEELNFNLSITGFDDDEIELMLNPPDLDGLFEEQEEERNKEEHKKKVVCPNCGFEFEVEL